MNCNPLLDLILDYWNKCTLNPTDDTIVTNPPFDVPDEDVVQDGIVFNDSPNNYYSTQK